MLWVWDIGLIVFIGFSWPKIMCCVSATMAVKLRAQLFFLFLTSKDGAGRLPRNVGKKLRNDPEERSTHPLRCGSLKARKRRGIYSTAEIHVGCSIQLPQRDVTPRVTCTTYKDGAPVAYPGILFGGGGSTNSVEDRGQRERGSGER